jgi:hypothetical protein
MPVMPAPLPDDKPSVIEPPTEEGTLRRLTRDEYNNTIRDLLSDNSHPADYFTADAIGESGFATPVGVNGVDARRLLEAAESLAASFHTRGLLPKCPAVDGEDCVTTFIKNLGGRTYRRPLTPTEIDEMLELHRRARNEFGFDQSSALEYVLSALLASPHFLYHDEGGDDPAAQLNGHGMASRLSYFLWNSMPDAALFAAAGSGELAGSAGIEKQARRLLASPKARDSIASFHRQWLNIEDLFITEKDPKLFPEFTSLRVAALAETERFAWSVILDGEGTLEALLTAPYSYLDGTLAKVYGVTISASFAKVDLDPARRAGILTQPAFLSVTSAASETSPVKRGQMIRERLLCQPVPQPPADVPPVSPASVGVTTRERFIEHATNGACKGCHALMDPLGFAFESLDAIGRWRDSDHGQPVDSSGAVTGLPGEPGFRGARELTEILAGSEVVRRCVASRWIQYALGRRQSEADTRALAPIEAAFGSSNDNIKDLMLAISRAVPFTHRAILDQEVEQ